MRARAGRRALAVLAAVTAVTAMTSASSASGATALAVAPIAHGDNFTNGAMVMQTGLQTSSGVVPLELPASEHAQALALAGQRVEVLGSHLSKSNAASAHAAIAPGSTRTMRIAVVMMRLPGSAAEPVTKAAVQASTFGATNSVANWYSQMSGKRVVVTGKVYGYYAGVSSCDLVTQTAAAAAAAKKAGYVASNYDNLVVYTPSQPCGFAGMGWVGANGVFLNGTVDRGVMEHELGHNLGLLHAGEYECGVASPSASCLIDYGDPTDVMGATDLNRGYSAQHKFALGWIPSSEVATVTTGTRTIALTASENPLVAGSTELIHVRAADGTLYAIDRRASVGYDAGLSGVWIRRVAAVNTDDTELVRSSALAAGQTFTDSVHHVTIKTVADSGPTASVFVCVGACGAIVATQTTSPGPINARAIVTGSKTAAVNAALTLTVPSGRGVVAGHTVIVATYTSRVTGAVSCRDTAGNVYAVNVNSVGAQRLIICSAHVTKALPPGAKITTAYPAFSGPTVSSANQFSAIAAGASLDKKSAGGADSSTVSSGPTVTTTRAAELVFGVEIHHGTPNFTPASGLTRIGGITYLAGSARMTVMPLYKVVPSTGSYRLSGTLSAAQQWRAAIVTYFKA